MDHLYLETYLRWLQFLRRKKSGPLKIDYNKWLITLKTFNAIILFLKNFFCCEMWKWFHQCHSDDVEEKNVFDLRETIFFFVRNNIWHFLAKKWSRQVVFYVCVCVENHSKAKFHDRKWLLFQTNVFLLDSPFFHIVMKKEWEKLSLQKSPSSVFNRLHNMAFFSFNHIWLRSSKKDLRCHTERFMDLGKLNFPMVARF